MLRDRSADSRADRRPIGATARPPGGASGSTSISAANGLSTGTSTATSTATSTGAVGRATDAAPAAADAPDVVRIVDDLLAAAVADRASDLHLEAADDGVRVRHRVDGVIREVRRLPRTLGPPLVSRLKILAALDIADRLRPQDGRAAVTVRGRPLELRVSTLPAARGENVVLRLQDGGAALATLDALGLPPDDRARLERLLDAREGLVLVTGPTGSGKTTTLYAALRGVLARGGLNVVTVEDPVERRLPGVVQVQVHERAGLGFAAALRSILRQDPDVVLVGEIRDGETARVAAQAAMTGHLVLATCHTLDAVGAVGRLADLGVEPFQLAAALRGAVAQRLVRTLCPACRRPVPAGWCDLRLDGAAPAGETVWQAPGDGWPMPAALRSDPLATDACADCGGTGYRGRAAVVEVLAVDGAVARLVGSGGGAAALLDAARAGGMRTLWEGGVARVRSGSTSCAELLRVLEPPRRDGEPAARPTSARVMEPAAPPLDALSLAALAGTPADAPTHASTSLPDLDAAFDLVAPAPRPRAARWRRPLA